MTDAPRLDYYARPRGARQLVLLAHGGLSQSSAGSSGWWPPLLRMLPFAGVAVSTAPSAAVAMLRYRLQGWNGESKDAATDLRTVLRELPTGIERVLLIGHSMGGRAVVHAAGSRAVVGVCALAPWLPSGEPLGDLGGRRLVFAHGTADTTTDFGATAEFVRRCRQRGWPAAFFAVAGEQHQMLRRAPAWEDLVARFVATGTSGRPDRLLDDATTSDPSRRPTPLAAAGRGGAPFGAASVVAASLRMAPRRLRLNRTRPV